MATLPPMDESTWASSVVGACTRPMPRWKVAATKPARSPTTPPPRATRVSERAKPASMSRPHSASAAARRLAPLPRVDRQDDRRVPRRRQRIEHRTRPQRLHVADRSPPPRGPPRRSHGAPPRGCGGSPPRPPPGSRRCGSGPRCLTARAPGCASGPSSERRSPSRPPGHDVGGEPIGGQRGIGTGVQVPPPPEELPPAPPADPPRAAVATPPGDRCGRAASRAARRGRAPRPSAASSPRPRRRGRRHPRWPPPPPAPSLPRPAPPAPGRGSAASPWVRKMSATGAAARASTCASRSTNGTPSSTASRRPASVFPAPIGPTSQTCPGLVRADEPHPGKARAQSGERVAAQRLEHARRRAPSPPPPRSPPPRRERRRCRSARRAPATSSSDAEVHRGQRGGDGGDGLHHRPEDDRLAVGDAALQARRRGSRSGPAGPRRGSSGRGPRCRTPGHRGSRRPSPPP